MLQTMTGICGKSADAEHPVTTCHCDEEAVGCIVRAIRAACARAPLQLC
jgi:hypothetical protein